MPKMRPANATNAAHVRTALDSLRFARDQLQRADCPQALAIVRRAIKSTEGAYRHALRRVSATERAATIEPVPQGQRFGDGPQWLPEHGDAADAEGWSIFHNTPDHTDPHIERDDEADILSCDGEACALVLAGTEPHHIAARAYIEHHNPKGMDAMREHAEQWRAELPEGYLVQRSHVPVPGPIYDRWIVLRPDRSQLTADFINEPAAIAGAIRDAEA